MNVPPTVFRFDSDWGIWSVSWQDSPGGASVVALGFPQVDRANAQSPSDHRDAPGAIRNIADKIRRHLAGDLQDFGEVAVDLSGTAPFTREVCRWIRSIPAGELLTYGEVARALGKPQAARAVGQALSRNPVGLVVPCHRVVGASGLTGFSAPGGVATKERLLRLERAGL